MFCRPSQNQQDRFSYNITYRQGIDKYYMSWDMKNGQIFEIKVLRSKWIVMSKI